MKSLPFDMNKLDSLTEGKQSVKQEITDIFFFNISECLQTLEKNCYNGSNATWGNASEELKNISIQFGALELYTLSKLAEEHAKLSAAEKKKDLSEIKHASQRLKAFLKNIT